MIAAGTTRYGFYAAGSATTFASNVEIFAEGSSYNRDHAVFNAGPNLSTGITYKPDNAYLIQTLGAARLAGITSVTRRDDRRGSALSFAASTTNVRCNGI